MSQLNLNLIQGSVRINFDLAAAQDLQKHIGALMSSLKASAIAAGERQSRPEPKATMEYRYSDGIFFEVFCNPNIYPSPFAAKVLLTIKDDKIRLTSEAELTQLREDIDRYLESNV